MKLHVLHVDQASASAVGHGNAVAARTGRIRRMQEDAAQSACREYGFLGQNREDGSRRLIEDIRSDAGKWKIDIRGFARVM